jgi:N utilization substance protein B
MTRNEAREIMMQILYELDATKALDGEKAAALAAQRLPGDHARRGGEILSRTIDSIEEIDADINRCATKWKTARMPKVDLAIMRLACGELRFCDDIPEAVTVNESINMAKKYSTENSARFIHGVLGAITKGK